MCDFSGMKSILLVVLSSLLVSCADQLGSFDAAPVAAYEARSQGVGKVKLRKVIKTGRMDLTVSDAKESAKSVESIVELNKGRIDEMSQGGDVRIELRVPSEKLEVAMSEFTKLGVVSYQRISSEDVTDKYIDVHAKLKNLKTLRSRLHKLYAKGEKVEELIQVEKEMARVQAEIDSLEGRMKSMQRDIQFSKVVLTLNKKTIPGPLGVAGKSIVWVFKKLWVLN